jgi:hypothetical protein
MKNVCAIGDIRRHKKPTKRRILIGILGLTIGIYVLTTILSTLSA